MIFNKLISSCSLSIHPSFLFGAKVEFRALFFLDSYGGNMWKPYTERFPRPPCEGCGQTNYIRPHSNNDGYIVCNLYCYYAVKWRKGFGYLTPVNDKYRRR
jgi:hypothetical protein